MLGVVVAVTLIFKPNSTGNSFSPEEIKAQMELGAIRYFVDNAHPRTGLVRDKADNQGRAMPSDHVASMASTGFGLAVIANAAERGLVSRAFAEDYALKALRFSKSSVPRRKGWFLHWVDWETAEKAWDSEYSTIDTALFIAGALYAGQVFPGTEVQSLAQELYKDLDFQDAMTDGGALPQKRTISMAYSDGKGFTDGQWDMYAEQRILLILGLGHPTNPLPAEAWLKWARPTTKLANSDSMMGYNAALFIHQYSELFLDFRNFNDGFGNYFKNGVVASELHRTMARQEDAKWLTYKAGFWGFSAGESPKGYDVYDPSRHSGTVCIGCALGSAMYLPDSVLRDAAAWMEGPYSKSLWGRYGFVDSIDLDKGWFSNMVLGITVGPIYMSLADMKEETSIWKTFMKIPEIQKGMAIAAQASTSMDAAVRPQ